MSPSSPHQSPLHAGAPGRPGTVRRLPIYLQPPELSVAEFAAARLDGEVFAFEDGFCSVDEPDTLELRAAVLDRIPGLQRAVIAELSAAWVHGAVLLAPRQHTGYVASERRSANGPRLRIRQVVLRDGDTEQRSGLRMTTPTRTVADLARRTGADAAPALQAIRSYFMLGLTSPEEVVSWVRARPRVLGGSRIERVMGTATDVTLPGLEPSRGELASWSSAVSRR